MIDNSSVSPRWGEYRPSGFSALLVWLSRSTPLGRGAPRRVLARLFSTLSPGPVDTDLFGARVRLHLAHNVTERKALMRPDSMDPKEHAVVRARMAAAGAVFVDVGANAGIYNLDAALHAGRGARILSIDPNPELLARLAFNIGLARADGLVGADVTVTAVCVAISDRDGTGVLAGNNDEGGRSLEGSGEGLSVPLKPLAGLVAEHGLPRIDILKIDVEGHEHKVLPPYLAAVPPSLWPRAIIIEHLAREHWAVDCIADAQSKGYVIGFATPNNTVLERAD